MRPRCVLGLLAVLLAACSLSGCAGSKKDQPRDEDAPQHTPKDHKPTDQAPPSSNKDRDSVAPGTIKGPGTSNPDAPVDIPQKPDQAALVPAASPQERFDAALLEGLMQRSAGKHTEALAAFEAARTIQDDELIQHEIDKEKASIARQAVAEQTLADIQAVLNDGKAEEASRLATTALLQYGGTDAAEPILKLKRQADALVALQVSDNTARKERFVNEGKAAWKDNNLRAAAVAFENALQAGDDPALKQQLDGLRVTLTRYDENRQRAGELRRDPATLEDALAALQEADKAWDTLQVRQEIDECQLTLERRRARLSVAEFEVRGDVGVPFAGQTIADELLPAFKTRFDLVERAQVGKIMDELKLEAGDLANNDQGRRDFARLARIRFLVVGSVSQLGGVTVQARLVDVRSGLIVQTAKVTAPTVAEVLPLLPQLAAMLLMTDEQKMAFEQDQALKAAAVQPVVVAPVPEAPPAPAVDQASPPPILVNTPLPPAFGGLRAGALNFAPAPPAGQPWAAVPIDAGREAVVRGRLLALTVELGDNLFRRGRFREAQAQFEFALLLSPGHRDLLIRLERCRPLLPPDVVVVVPARPRIALLPFIVAGDPAVVPPGLSLWTPDNLAPYFVGQYDLVDRGIVFWYMARLGLTMNDLYVDPAARLWLGRALGVRYFLFGEARQTGSFDVLTHLVDSEYGFEIGAGRVHVRNAWELRLRLGELAWVTLLDPVERERFLRGGDEYEALLLQARQHHEKHEFAIAIEFYQKARKLRPRSIEVVVLLDRTQDDVILVEFEQGHRRAWDRDQELIVVEIRRRQELARATELARIQAAQDAASLTEAARQEQRRRWQLAYEQLLLRGQTALTQGNFPLAIQIFESALAFQQTDAAFRGLAQARAGAGTAYRLRLAEEKARREEALRKQREAELAQVRAQLERERAQREAEEKARREAREREELAEYNRLLERADRLLAQGKYEEALALLQTARRLRRTDKVEAMIATVTVQQARAAADKKGKDAVADLERQLAEEKVRRERAEAEAKVSQERYAQLLREAQQARAARQYDQAIVKFQAAAKIYRTDVALAGEHEAAEARAQEKARAEAEQRKQAEAQQKAARVQALLTEGKQALEGKQFDRAVKSLTEARQLDPANVEVLTALAKAEQARADAAAQARTQQGDAERQRTFQKLLDSGRANLAAKHYDAAVLALTEALKLNPSDPTARAALQEAEKALAADASLQAETRKKKEQYQKLMADGRLALSSKQYDVAIKAFRDALKLVPDDQSAAAFLKDAEKAQSDQAAVLAAEAKKREAEQKRAADVQRALTQGRAALQARDLDAAARFFKAAADLAPNDPDVVRAQQDLQKAQEASRAEAEARKQRQEKYQALLKTGRDALAAKRYPEAIKAFQDALTLIPGDKDATALLKDAEKATDEARAADAEAKKKAEFTRLMTAGQNALAAKKYEEAVKAFTEAKNLMPNDPTAAKALADATRALEASRTPPKPDPKVEYAKHFKGGADLENQHKYADAQQAYSQALQDLPNDAEAKNKVTFCQHMVDGQKALANKKFADAQKEFTEALKLYAGNQDAKDGLKKAKDGKP